MVAKCKTDYHYKIKIRIHNSENLKARWAKEQELWNNMYASEGAVIIWTSQLISR